MESKSTKVGLGGLVAIVFGSMIGGGIFNIPQNMAAEASLGAVIISWIISGIGVGMLVYTFKTLSEERSDISSGIYGYAKAGFGRFVGFNSAWGYWISAALGNVAFAVMLNDAFGVFFPVLLKHGWQTIVFGSGLIWLMNFISLFGTEKTSFLNTVSTIAKFVGLIIVIGILVISFKFDIFTSDFWGNAYHLDGLAEQIKSTMLVTLWCFIGIEGAVVISSKAKKSSDVGTATTIGFIAALVMYVLISVLAFGIAQQPELAKLSDPSAGALLGIAVGSWGATFVNIAVIISVLGAWIAWTILVAEVPHDAAKDGVLPAFFKKENKNGAPSTALYISSSIMQVAMIFVAFASDVYMAAIDIAGVMILPAYLLSSMYLLKGASLKQLLKNKKNRKIAAFIGLLSTLYCLWLIYAAGISYMLTSFIFYAIGIPFYRLAHKDEVKAGKQIYTRNERLLEIFIIIMALVAVVMIATGQVSF
ncbi:basic amino acid/polyamine antiporter [Flammeovirga kamogawensis]|uniref:Basic amino acid/polyamine antiporter n=1 Tax=Flammeovirga kamogawensis TaxID=373891 RepID=A0ABX8H2G3_9BACT|nr:basic amino acid/polyamine antiporter [Flammeovirga kamogawensis]MBB6463583.1 arginine:ornithine antiporter/lysine permease [Flammeovirga kamogawensis]QWG09809.1 basic amino acid/polyamine antiporter [Flammeovirga kamogawensis]TRX65317.1 amino acid permease [Flammeovirga kamogawensis]